MKVNLVSPHDLSPQHQDPLVFCLKHPGIGKLYFKTDTEEMRDRLVALAVNNYALYIYTESLSLAT